MKILRGVRKFLDAQKGGSEEIVGLGLAPLQRLKFFFFSGGVNPLSNVSTGIQLCACGTLGTAD